MAMTTNEIELIFKANAEEFRKDIAGIKDELAGIKGSAGAVAGAVGGGGLGKAMLIAQMGAKVLTKAVQVTGRALSKMVKSVVVGGTQLSRMRIATNTVANNMGIASSEVDTLRKSLSEANTYGIKAEQVINSLARTGLFEMAEGLKAVDARTGEWTTGISALVLEMKDLGAVAGKSSSEAIAELTDFINRGVTANVDSMVAIGNLGTEYRMYAKSIGVARESMTAQQEAEARLQLVHRESKKALGAYANSYTTAGKMMDSLKDATSSIAEEIGSALEPVFATVSSAVLEFVKSVRNWILDNWNTIRAWAIQISAWVTVVVRAFSQAMQKMKAFGQFFADLTGFELKTGGAVVDTTDDLAEQTEKMDETTSSAGKLAKELAGLSGFDEMNVLKKPDSSGAGGGGTTEEEDPESNVDGVDEAVDNMLEETETKFQKFWKKISDWLEPLTTFWNENVKPAWDGMIAQFGLLFDAISNSPIGDILKVIAEIVLNVVVGAFMALISVVMWVITGITWIVTKNIEAWTDRFNFAVAILTELILEFRELPEKIREYLELVKGIFTVIWTGISTFLTNWFKREIKHIKDFINGIVAKWNEFKAKVEFVWAVLKLLVKVGIDYMRYVIKKGVDNIKGFFVGIWSTAKWVFQAVGDWIWNKISWAVNKVKGILGSLKSGFSGFFTNIAETIKVPINWIINKINGMIRSMNKWRIPIILENGLNIKPLPTLAQGGTIKEDTMAILHKSSDEAVLPLNGNNEWIERLASKINTNGGGSTGTIIVKIGDEQIAQRVIDFANDKAKRTGVNLLNM